MSSTYWCNAHYLDASALVKLVADDPTEEPGREVLRKYYWGHAAHMYATSYPYHHGSVLRLQEKVLAKADHRGSVRELPPEVHSAISWGRPPEGQGAGLLSPVVMSEAERLIKKYKIDFLDCFQIVTIMHGATARARCNSSPFSSRLMKGWRLPLGPKAREFGNAGPSQLRMRWFPRESSNREIQS